MSTFTRRLLLAFAALVLTGTLRAQLTIITSTTAFDGSEQVQGFNTLVQGEAILTQFSAQGLTFSTGLYGSTNSGDTRLYPNNADGVIATNFITTSPLLTWTITFTNPEAKVGFLVEMNVGDSVTLAPSLGGVAHGTVTYNSAGVTPVFFGVADAGGFDTLTFTVSGPDNHFFAMDNFRYQAVPEPETALLLGLGLVAVFARSRRQWLRGLVGDK